jgi:two-component system nitrate/nitrite response regulator NarL
MMPATSVVVAIGNDVVRFGIERMLQAQGIDVVPVGSAVDAVADERRLTIMIVLLAEYSDETRLRLSALEDRGVRVLVLMDPRDTTDAPRLTGVPAAGFLTIIDLDGRTLADALHRIAAGELALSSCLARDLLTAQPRPRLTPRELEALRLLVEGLSNKQMARRLDISEHGAKRLVANILSKMDCPNRTTAVAKALRDGLAEPAA